MLRSNSSLRFEMSKKFGSLEELRAAIADDQLKAKQILGLRI